MGSLNYHISKVQNAPDRGTANRARSLTKRTIASYIHTVRGLLISKDVEKADSFPVALQQDLGCWPLTQVDQADCPCGWEWGDDVKKAEFPAVAELKNNSGIAFFGLIDKVTRIYLPDQVYGELDNHTRFKGKGKNEWKSQMIGNNVIYIKGPQLPRIKVVNIRGIFKDPTQVDFYYPDGSKKCFDWDNDNYPIPLDLEDVMYQMIWSKYILPMQQLPRDNSNQENNKASV